MTHIDIARSKQLFIPVLLAALVAAIVIQTWVLLDMQRQLDALHSQQPVTMVTDTDASTPGYRAIKPGLAAAKLMPRREPRKIQPAVAYQNIYRATVPAVSAQLIQTAADNRTPYGPPAKKHYNTADNWQPWDVPPRDMPPWYAQPGDIHPWNRQPRERPPWKRPEENYWRHWSKPDRDFGNDNEWQTWDRLTRDLQEEIRRMHRDIDRMFRDYERAYDRHNRRRPDDQYSFQQNFSAPKMKVKEDSTQYIITVNLPGADENDISVSLEGQRLSIKSKRKTQKETRDSTGNVVFRAQSSGNFQRSITLPEPVIKNAMKTKTDKGVLTIIIPKDKDPA